jgi:molybdenum cofactor cytidylyltransferase
MGQPKLLLPLGGATVIARLLAVLARPEITTTVVVLRHEDEPLRAAVAAQGAIPLQPEVDPPDMRSSVQCGLGELRARFTPTPEDGWLLIPADHPVVECAVLDQLLQRWGAGDCRILVPTFQQRRGHPTLFRWDLALEVPQIPPDQGLNRLLREHAAEMTELPVEHESVLLDLDTPEDYAALCARYGSVSGDVAGKRQRDQS